MKPDPSQNTTVRLQVFLSHSGVCSRRKAMVLVQGGHVAVNGVINKEPSTPVDPDKDKIAVDGKPIERKGYDYLLLNKPAGCVTTRSDRFVEKTVLDLLPSNMRHVNPVGRLDKDTEGLLLLTNDGAVANKLTHPRFDVDKIYIVRIHGQLTFAEQSKLEMGVVIEGGKTAPAKITNIRTHARETEFLMTIHEGRKRQIRLMLKTVGRNVIFLKRIQQGPLKLGELKSGQFRHLTPQEIQQLRKV